MLRFHQGINEATWLIVNWQMFLPGLLLKFVFVFPYNTCWLFFFTFSLFFWQVGDLSNKVSTWQSESTGRLRSFFFKPTKHCTWINQEKQKRGLLNLFLLLERGKENSPQSPINSRNNGREAKNLLPNWRERKTKWKKKTLSSQAQKADWRHRPAAVASLYHLPANQLHRRCSQSADQQRKHTVTWNSGPWPPNTLKTFLI